LRNLRPESKNDFHFVQQSSDEPVSDPSDEPVSDPSDERFALPRRIWLALCDWAQRTRQAQVEALVRREGGHFSASNPRRELRPASGPSGAEGDETGSRWAADRPEIDGGANLDLSAPIIAAMCGTEDAEVPAVGRVRTSKDCSCGYGITGGQALGATITTGIASSTV
jgi:hypothetical protein